MRGQPCDPMPLGWADTADDRRGQTAPGGPLMCAAKNRLGLQPAVYSHLEHLDRDGEVRVVPLVRNVPADRAELLALDDHGVVEREAEKKLRPRLLLGARVEDRVREICTT